MSGTGDIELRHESTGSHDAHITTADAVARRSYGKLVAFLAARTHNVAAAEDALSEAFTTALTDWPRNGCPDNPEAWLLTVARRKLIDMNRRHQTSENAPRELSYDDVQNIADLLHTTPTDADPIPDRRLALMFACAHPAIDARIRAPLILQVILGFDAEAIASAFLMSPPAMGQRLVRAKNKIRHAGIPFRIPEREELPARLDSVLQAIYAAFSEGWVDAAGTDVARRELAQEAIYLGRVVASLLPDQPEALGLVALMLYAEARRGARRSPEGDYIPLTDQSPTFWNHQLIREAEALLLEASALGSIGRYQLEAAIQSAHVTRRLTGEFNWPSIVRLYDALFSLIDSPVVAINRALAIAETDGPAAALEAMPDIYAEPSKLTEYQPYWAARAELLTRSGAHAEAREAYEIAIGLERDPAVRRFLQQRQCRL
jgi:RNA polymerase sigma-70 factor, ECF subfamily